MSSVQSTAATSYDIPDNAVDGDWFGTCTSTSEEDTPCWYVDLLDVYEITAVWILNIEGEYGMIHFL